MRSALTLGVGSLAGLLLGLSVALISPLGLRPSGAAPSEAVGTFASVVTPTVPSVDTKDLAPSVTPTADRYAPVPGSPYLRSAPTRLVIPSIGLDSKVVAVETVYDRQGRLVWQTANHAVGYHLGTGFPGEPGNIVLSGHISHPTEGSVFKRLPDVKVGDGIILFTLGDAYLYQVVDTKVVLPSETSVMDPTSDETLTLITCVPDGVYSHRLIVVAKRS